MKILGRSSRSPFDKSLSHAIYWRSFVAVEAESHQSFNEKNIVSRWIFRQTEHGFLWICLTILYCKMNAQLKNKDRWRMNWGKP